MGRSVIFPRLAVLERMSRLSAVSSEACSKYKAHQTLGVLQEGWTPQVPLVVLFSWPGCPTEKDKEGFTGFTATRLDRVVWLRSRLLAVKCR